MVAFLQALPSLDANEYRRMAMGEPRPAADAPIRNLLPEEAPPALAASCARCHGVDEVERGLGAFPKLAGQKPDYLLASLEAYASGRRGSGMMEPIAAALTPETMRELVQYYSRLPAGKQSSESNNHSSAIERGRAIAHYGIPGQRVPACIECHGPSLIPRNPAYPLLAGQYPEYLILQLELFKKKTRGGTAYSHLMHFVAGGLTAEQMSDVARYFASLNPKLEGGR